VFPRPELHGAIRTESHETTALTKKIDEVLDPYFSENFSLHNSGSSPRDTVIPLGKTVSLISQKCVPGLRRISQGRRSHALPDFISL
jgi:hypothetical protein